MGVSSEPVEGAGTHDGEGTPRQFFVAYAASGGWAYTLNTQSTHDWIAEEWSVPLLAQISKLTKIGEQPVSLAAGLKYWAQAPNSGPHGFGAVASISFILKGDHRAMRIG